MRIGSPNEFVLLKLFKKNYLEKSDFFCKTGRKLISDKLKSLVLRNIYEYEYEYEREHLQKY